MLWHSDTPPCDKSFLGPFAPKAILVEYNGPRIFTLESQQGQLLLAYHCDEDDNSWRYAVVPFSTVLLESLMSGAITIVDAIHQPWAWIVDIDNGGTVMNVWPADPTSLPTDYLPSSDVRLVDRPHDDFSVKLIGKNITGSGVALSVIRSASERTHKSIRKLVDHIGVRSGIVGFSDRDSRRHSDVMASHVLLASFEISVELPDPALLPAATSEEDVLFAKELRRLLGRVIEWSAHPELMDEPDKQDPSESVAILQSIEDLTPSGRNEDSEVQIGGKLVATIVGKNVSLRKELRPRLKAAIRRRVDTGSIDGWVEQLPQSISAVGNVGTVTHEPERNWFILTDLGTVYYLDSRELIDEGEWMYGERILFIYDPKLWLARILSALGNGRKVAAVGAIVTEAIADDNLQWPRAYPVYNLLDLRPV